MAVLATAGVFAIRGDCSGETILLFCDKNSDNSIDCVTVEFVLEGREDISRSRNLPVSSSGEFPANPVNSIAAKRGVCFGIPSTNELPCDAAVELESSLGDNAGTVAMPRGSGGTLDTLSETSLASGWAAAKLGDSIGGVGDAEDAGDADLGNGVTARSSRIGELSASSVTKRGDSFGNGGPCDDRESLWS